MQVIGFIGASGTGKSHHALVVAYDHHISCIIDDGLLIYQNRIIAGQSAKDETNKMRAVRCAIFLNPDHAQSVKHALAQIHPDKLLVLGTSRHMIHRICESLGLPLASSYIHIEDISSPEEIAKARSIRQQEGKHIIPVPTMELKPHFRGYLLKPIRLLLSRHSDKKTSDIEHAVVRPIFSYYGKLIFSKKSLDRLVQHALLSIDGLAKIDRMKIEKNYYTDRGLAIILSVTIYYGEPIKTIMQHIKQALQKELEYTTGMSVEILRITVRAVLPR